MVNAELAEDTFGLQVAFPKIEAYTARLALWLHIVNAVLRDQKPSQVINGDTMERAIELAAYYLWQYRLIHTYNSPDAGLAALALKVQKFAERVGQATASALKSGIRTLRKMATDQIRQLMQTLANAGYGQIVGEGTQMVYVPVATHGSPTEKERNHATSNGQFVNLATEYAAGAGTGATDRECQLERQLSATRIDIVENNSQSLVSGNGLKSRNSSGEIDTIDAKLTAASIPQTQIMSATQMPVDITDREKRSHKNIEAANFNAETRVDESDATFEQVVGDDASLSHTWNGFKVGDLVRLSYNRTGVNASVIDPAKYPEMGAQPASDYVPIKPTDTGKPEWYPAAWLY